MVTSLDLLARQFMDTKVHIEEITGQIRDAAETDEQARLLQTMPGIGPITASAIVAHISDTSAFRTSREVLHLTQAEIAAAEQAGVIFGDPEEEEEIHWDCWCDDCLIQRNQALS